MLSNDQRDHISHIFSILDKDGTGSINQAELRDALSTFVGTQSQQEDTDTAVLQLSRFFEFFQKKSLQAQPMFCLSPVSKNAHDTVFACFLTVFANQRRFFVVEIDASLIFNRFFLERHFFLPLLHSIICATRLVDNQCYV